MKKFQIWEPEESFKIFKNKIQKACNGLRYVELSLARLLLCFEIPKELSMIFEKSSKIWSRV